MSTITRGWQLKDINWRWAFPRILLAFLVTRLLVLVVAVAVETTQPAPPAGIRADERPLIGSLTAWDGVHYLSIVEEGYQTDADPFPNYAFFPAYPILVRATSLLTATDAGIAALIVSNLALLAALVVLYALSVRYLRPERAVWSLWFLLLAPGAIGFSMSYTEGLFLVFAAGAFLAAETRHPWTTGVLLALAALTRVPGILLVLPLLVMYVGRDGLRPTREWLPLGLAPLAVGAYFVYLWTVTGDLLAALHAQDYWRSTGPNAEAVVTQNAAATDPTMIIGTAPTWVIGLWVASIAFYAFLFVFFRHDRIAPAYWLMAALAIFGVFASGKLLSAPRYMVTAWPFDWVLANRASLTGRILVLVGLAVVQVLLLWFAFTWQLPP